MTRRGISIFTAYLIAFCAADLVVPIVDFFMLPLPRHVFGISWSAAFGIVALLILWPSLRDLRVPLLEAGGVGALFILVFWVVLEGMRPILGGVPDYTLIISCFPALFVSQLIRFHLRVFSDYTLLIETFVFTVVVLAIIHAVLLVVTLSDISIPFVNANELISRNGISLLLVVAVLASTLLADDITGEHTRLRLVGLLGFAFLHIYLNSARGAGILLVLLLLLWGLREKAPDFRGVTPLLLLTSVIVILGAIFSYPLLNVASGFAWFGAGDNALSTAIRSGSNWTLLVQFLDSPLHGLGWQEVLSVRSEKYISHTFYVIILAAYGVIGMAPFVLLAVSWVRSVSRRDQQLRVMTMLLILTMATFVNDPLPLYGFILALLSARGQRACTAERRIFSSEVSR